MFSLIRTATWLMSLKHSSGKIMAQISKEQLLKDLQTAKDGESRLHCVINDLLNKEVTWFRKGPHWLGIARPSGAEGGLVIHQERFPGRKPYAVAYSWESWWPGIRDRTHALDKSESNLRDCAYEALTYIQKMQGL